MTRVPISDYAILGNGHTLALASRTGSVDWMCLPFPDSPAVFAALLDERSGGRFAIRPDRDFDAASRYRPGTNVLDTRFRVRAGEALLTDFMPAGPVAREHPENNGRLARRVHGLTGEVRLWIVCDVRFDTGRRPARWERRDNRCWRLVSRDRHLLLTATRPLCWEEGVARLRLRAGEEVWLALTWGGESVPAEAELDALLESTERHWREWRNRGEIGRHPAEGFWRESLDRSALALKLLQFRPTGAIAAGATASLPGPSPSPIRGRGRENRDARHAEIRDAATTLTTLWRLGHVREAGAYLDWIREVLRDSDPQGPEPLHRLGRTGSPPAERALRHLAGYKGAGPPRVGGRDADRFPGEICGELLDLFLAVSRCLGRVSVADWEAIRPLADRAADLWRLPESGDRALSDESDDSNEPPRPVHTTHSKLMCWVALDRGIALALRYGFRADLGRWRTERGELRREILRRGVNRRTGAFQRHYGVDGVDPDLLRIPLVGFLPIHDRRVAATIRAVEAERIRDGGMISDSGEAGASDPSLGFSDGYFRYLRCLIRQGRPDAVEAHLRRMGERTGATGLFGEGFDPVFREILGNYPCAFSHIGHAATALDWLEAREVPAPPPPRAGRLALLFRIRRLSPPRKPIRSAVPPDPIRELHEVADRLAGHFQDGHERRIDYAALRNSPFFERMRRCIAALRGFDPAILAADPERIAFWANLFNVLTIHAVLELGIRNSVREVPFFFRRAVYEIGGRPYRLGDIEHGILRGNRRPPYGPSRSFAASDPRRRFAPETFDPRVHFVLVRAGRTDPPLEACVPETLEERFEIAARGFVNGTSRLDLDERTLWVSELFKWYRADFGRRDGDLVRFAARYWYRSDAADRMFAGADRIAIRYFPYDRRLNR